MSHFMFFSQSVVKLGTRKIVFYNTYYVKSMDSYLLETTKKIEVMKDKLLVTKCMKYLPNYQYVHNFLKQLGLGHSTAFIYEFIGDDMEKKSNILQYFIFTGLRLCIEIKSYAAYIFMDIP